MASAILDQFGRPYVRERQIDRRNTFDMAKTTDENRKHWANTDNLSAVSQLTPQVRQTLRNRARYEVQNNSYATGLIRTLVNDTVGRGPRLQMMTPSSTLNKAVEELWREWSAASDWALTVRMVAGVRYVAGETFGIFRESKRLDRMGLPVNLDLKLIEPEQVTSSLLGGIGTNPTGDDGIICDEEGEVVAYEVLKNHPGDNRQYTGTFTPQRIDAGQVLHWYCPERPGQLRGYTPLTPSLGIFAQLRRFTTATLTAAEIASMLSGIMMQDGNLGMATAEVTAEASYATIDMVRGMLLTLPPGATVEQFKPEQPTTNYQMFVDAKLRECGRCLNVPFGKMAGDHSNYNYSSGRLDDAPYWADRDMERQALESKVFNPFFYRWCEFAKFAIPALIAFEGQWWKLRHEWEYDARPTSDPVKDATGDELNLTNGTDSLPGIAARAGTTEDALLDARAATMKKFEERGLPLPAWLAGQPAPVRMEPGEPQPNQPQKRQPQKVAA